MNTPEKAADELIEKYKKGFSYAVEFGDTYEIAKDLAIIDVTGKIELLEQVYSDVPTVSINRSIDELNAVLTNLKSG